MNLLRRYRCRRHSLSRKLYKISQANTQIDVFDSEPKLFVKTGILLRARFGLNLKSPAVLGDILIAELKKMSAIVK